jgi:predicted nucleic acid-binding protein
MGCRNSLELANHQKFMQMFPIIWPTAVDMDLTLTSYAPLKLSHNFGGFDALIAATAVGGGHTLLTRNVKHFQPVPGLFLEIPYA